MNWALVADGMIYQPKHRADVAADSPSNAVTTYGGRHRDGDVA